MLDGLQSTTQASLNRYAAKSTLADKITIENCVFSHLRNAFSFADEKENKGYYSVEKIAITNNRFLKGDGILLDLYRGGSDESTLGPDLNFSNNTITNYNSPKGSALLQLTGVQKTKIQNNSFNNCNFSASIISYKDVVRATHILKRNKFVHSGSVEKNAFVVDEGNLIQ